MLPSLYSPASAANYRINMLREGELPDDVLRCIVVPTLLLCSARDRMLPSIEEGASSLVSNTCVQHLCPTPVSITPAQHLCPVFHMSAHLSARCYADLPWQVVYG